ncbi:expressed unknown protein [Seminavis robusta]|uniref:Uncharacterized protein n=1 Tax=Seminavis robusta TaxID=568900 RepID=A0A9N8HKH1_9STRA|nr:expressed unknown protein [Seminavis robusta]|eukprot:Sro839_g209240.1 n/a (438) ;mRNA; f:7991-9304
MAKPNDLVGLRRNDSHLTYLQLLRPDCDQSDSSLKELVHVLLESNNNTNTHVTRVRVMVQHRFFWNRTNNNDDNDSLRLRRQVFAAVGSLPKLQQLKIDSYMGLVRLPVGVLSDTIQRARQLRELELWDLKLMVADDSNDLEALQNALQDHPCLERFTLYNCQSLTDRNGATRACSLDPVVHALASMPKIEQVYITAAAANSSASSSIAFSCSALEHLCRSKTLKELGLWKFNFHSAVQHRQTATIMPPHNNNNEPLTFMAPALAQSNTMTMFEFGKCHLSAQGDLAMAAMLRTNTSLLQLDLHLDAVVTTDDDDDEDYFVATAEALEKHNRTLKSLKLWGLLSRRNQEALVAMIQHNYCLQTCRLLDADCDVSQQMEFYIGLNRRGRKQLFKTTCGSQWINALADCGRNNFPKQQDGLSAIYYYLSMKPGLLCCPK